MVNREFSQRPSCWAGTMNYFYMRIDFISWKRKKIMFCPTCWPLKFLYMNNKFLVWSDVVHYHFFRALTVVYFFAKWSPQYIQMSDVVQELSKDNPHVTFVKVIEKWDLQCDIN
jgi:hypothetical protein